METAVEEVKVGDMGQIPPQMNGWGKYRSKSSNDSTTERKFPPRQLQIGRLHHRMKTVVTVS